MSHWPGPGGGALLFVLNLSELIRSLVLVRRM